MWGGDGLGLIAWISKLVGGKRTAEEADLAAFFNLAAEAAVRELAFQSAENLIANALAACEVRTYVDGKVKKGPEWFLWNIKPNVNQNASAFYHKLVHQLYRKNEALVIGVGDQVLVADDFSREEYALLDYKFTGVTVDNLQFDKLFYASDVLYLRLFSADMAKLVSGLYESYGKLIAYSQKMFQRSKGSRGVLKISAMAVKQSDFMERFNRLTGADLKTFMENDNAVLPIYEGFDYHELDRKTYSTESSRDIRALVDDIYDFTARAFCIPPALLRGEVADTATALDNLLTLCLDPLAKMIAQEINGKRSGQAGMLGGTYVEFVTNTVKHVDVLNAGENVDKLIASGVFSINDILEMLGQPTIDAPWANRHFITKNYTGIESASEVSANAPDES